MLRCQFRFIFYTKRNNNHNVTVSGQDAKKTKRKIYCRAKKERYCEDWQRKRNARCAVMKLLSQWHLAPSSRARAFAPFGHVSPSPSRPQQPIQPSAIRLSCTSFAQQIYTPPALLAHALSSMPTFSHSRAPSERNESTNDLHSTYFLEIWLFHVDAAFS